MLAFETSNKNRFKMNMAPLIDVVFLLLIFFLLTSVTLGQGIDVRFPQGQAEEVAEVRELVVKIGQDNVIRVDGGIVEASSLFRELESKLRGRVKKNVVIEADKKSRYGLFAHVLDVARQAGAEDFSIVR